MKIRRVAVLLLSAMMVFTAVGCGDEEPERRHRKDREEEEYDEDYDDENADDGGLFGGRDDEPENDDETENNDDRQSGDWQVVEWGDDDSDEDCIPTRSEVEVNVDPDDPKAFLYYTWKDMDNDVFEVWLDFFPNGNWHRSSDGGMDEGGTFDYDGGDYVTLHYGDEDMVFTVEDDGRLLDPYGSHYAVVGNISEEVMQTEMSDEPDPYFEPLKNFYGRWLYDTYDSYFDIYPDGTWEFAESPEDGVSVSGNYTVIGNSQQTTLILQCEAYDDSELVLRMEGNKLIMNDSDDDQLKRVLKYF